MPHSPRRIQQLAKRLASQELDAQAAQFEERYQGLVAQFRTMQLQSQAVQTQFRAARKEYLWLQYAVCVKQHVIETLLPYYPHPLTPELVYAIELY